MAGAGMDGRPNLLLVMGEKGDRVYLGYLEEKRLNLFIVQKIQRRGNKKGMHSDWYFQTSQGNNAKLVLEHGVGVFLPILHAVVERGNLVLAKHLEELIAQVLE